MSYIIKPKSQDFTGYGLEWIDLISLKKLTIIIIPRDVIIKIDCEGAEFGILNDLSGECCQNQKIDHESHIFNNNLTEYEKTQRLNFNTEIKDYINGLSLPNSL